ncbi:fam-m protein [Plasmodium malariae]|uniref:Fam-m protein n=1 Tax=Plasmodium malariae TaxID=5858 RepID=A0A1D3JIX9_PLAMA|nr:fam-m protein [Plasmodium malariae]SBT86396.1 fam-m protein [Plasmodium malariae]
MEQNIKSILFIKITLFILLNWLCYFNNVVCTFTTSINYNCNVGTKLASRARRLLAKYKQNKNSYITGLNENISRNDGVYEKKNMYNKKKRNVEEKKQYNRSLLNKGQYYTEIVDYNNGMFDGKHFHFEKKLIKKIDYDNFLERKRRINDILLKKIKFKNYRNIVAIFFIFSLFAVAIDIIPRLRPLHKAFKSSNEGDILKYIYDFVNEWGDSVNKYIYITLYCVLMLILIIILVMGICKILRNNEKYNKIKLMVQ